VILAISPVTFAPDFRRSFSTFIKAKYRSVRQDGEVAPPPTRDDARCPDVGFEKAIS